MTGSNSETGDESPGNASRGRWTRRRALKTLGIAGTTGGINTSIQEIDAAAARSHPASSLALSGEWPVPGKDAAGTGSIGEQEPITGLAPRWTLDMSTSLPAVVEDTAYVRTSDGLKALDTQTGSVQWSYGGNVSGGAYPPAVANGRVFVANSGSIVALDADTGDDQWSQQIVESGSAYRVPITVQRNAVFASVRDSFQDSDNFLLRFSADSGEVAWQKELMGRSNGAPVVDNNRVYVTSPGSGGGQVLAFDRTDGSTDWTQTFESDSFVALERPIVQNGVLYVSDFNSSTYAYDAATGDQVWKSAGSGAISLSNGRLYASGAGQGDVLDAAAGDRVTGFRIFGAGTPAPTVAGDVVYLATSFDSSVRVIDVQENTQLAQYYPLKDTARRQQLTVTDDTVYAATSDKLYALESTDGAPPTVEVEITASGGDIVSTSRDDSVNEIEVTVTAGSTVSIEATAAPESSDKTLTHEWLGPEDGTTTGSVFDYTFTEATDPNVVEIIKLRSVDTQGRTDGRHFSVNVVESEPGTGVDTGTDESTVPVEGSSDVTVSVTNNTEESATAASLELTGLPDAVSITDVEADGTIVTQQTEFTVGDVVEFVDPPAPDETVEATLTVETSAEGEGDVGAIALEADLNGDNPPASNSVSIPVTASEGLAAAFDQNNNDEIEFPEVVDVIQAYNNEDSSIAFSDVVDVIQSYNGDGQWSSIGTGS